MQDYNHNEIEKKWQKFWLENKTFRAEENSAKPKFYALDMFPYPSGAGLHVGHPLGMTATDIISRKKRHEGFNVLHPMGWDAFGLPAENYAIKTGVHPQKSTQENIANFRRQIQSLGFSYDWNREIDTTDPNYYKWSQWIFLQLYKKGLAYESDKAMNWCPQCKIVAANEEVEQGMHERCGSAVEKKKLKQWMFRITDYAERLLNDLNTPNVHIFHGWGGDSKENWFENSRDFLEKNKVNCSVLDFPNSGEPDYQEWKTHFEKNVKNIWPQDVFIGHSLGCVFALRYLNEKNIKLDKLILVAPPQKIGGLNSFPRQKAAWDDIIKKSENILGVTKLKKFVEESKINWQKIRENINKIEIYYSDNDPYIPITHFEELADKLKAKKVFLSNREHLCDSNFPELREILDNIQRSTLDWPDKIKAMQRNWIGKSEGAEVSFEVENLAENTNTKKRGAKFPCGGCANDNQQPSLFDTTLFSKIKEVKFKKAKKLKISDIKSKVNKIYFSGGSLYKHWKNKSQSEKKFRGSFALTVIKSLDNLFYESENVGYFISKNKVFCVILGNNNDGKFVKTYYQSKKITKLYLKFIGKKEKITVYTTRPDTLFGATYFVLSPEHPLVEKITTAESREKVANYQKECANKSELERTELNKNKTGVFTGSYVINPVNGKKLPIWIADYVMMSYGTGAIMAVPAHDERDFEFAEKYDLPIIKVVDLENPFQKSGGKMINSYFLNGLSVEDAVEKMTEFLEKKKLGIKKTNYKLRDWIFTRQRYWGEPIPLVFDESGKCYPLADSELPLKLPETPNYAPSADGQSPLAKITDWVEVHGDIQEDGTVIISENGKTKFSRETSTMPNWAGSSWYWLRYMDPQNSANFCDKEVEKYWGPVDLYVGGAEHAVLHLLYSRFWHKVLFDLGLVSTKEPFKKLVNQGLIMGEDGNKMSKSLGNVVNPDIIVEKYGADTFRMYEMFMGPFDQSKPWASSAVGGMRRFLDRVWRVASKPLFDLKTSDDLCKIHGPELHKTVKIVGEHIDEFKFNTAISQMMVMINMLTPLDKIPREMLKRFAIILSPFAPHMAEEIWREKLGNKTSISNESWPEYDPQALIQDEVTYAVQVNGKVRGDFKIAKDAGKDEVLKTAKEIGNVAKYLAEGEIKKEIFVPGKIAGFVVK